MKWINYIPLLSVLFLYNCIGVDEVDLSSPLNQKITLENTLKENTQWSLNEKRALTATYYNIHSKMESITLEWFSSNSSILQISGDSVQAISAGEAFLYAKKDDIFSDTITIQVIDNDVFISINNQNIKVGNSEQIAITIKKDELKNKTITWKSSDESVATIDANGKITSVKGGTSDITATIDGIVSNSITITIAELQKRTAFFKTTTHYKTEGSAILQETADGKLELVFQDDADIDNGPSLYLILANKVDPPYTIKTDGTSLAIDQTSAQLTANKLSSAIKGKQTFQIPDDVNIDDYKYVVFYCILGPVFGSAELK